MAGPRSLTVWKGKFTGTLCQCIDATIPNIQTCRVVAFPNLFQAIMACSN